MLMSSRLWLGLGRFMIPLPGALWQRQIRARARKTDLGFMSEEHYLVREFVVQELPGVGEPISPGSIAQELSLPVARVEGILEELDRQMTFVCRNERGAVVWAYPVTVATTPHRVASSTGEEVYAA